MINSTLFIAQPLFQSPTQTVGILSYLATIVACLYVMFVLWKQHQPLIKSVIFQWSLLAILHVIMLLDVIFDMRFRATDTFRQLLKLTGLREMLHGQGQLIMIIVMTLLILAAGVWFILRCKRPGNSPLAWIGLMIGIAVHLGELISYHDLDHQIFWRKAGAVAVVGWLWMAGATIVIIGAYQASRQISSK